MLSIIDFDNWLIDKNNNHLIQKINIVFNKPLDNTKGAHFVHDVRVSNLKEVKGQVKLKIRKNIEGDCVSIIRSMKVTLNKANKLKFETLDSTIVLIDKNGKKVHSILNKKPNETNEFACEAIGVSKAVLNNVIFCHQEDANWPMDEGKKLKEKFDAIFDTTEYDIAIDKLIASRKLLLTNQKLSGKRFSYLFLFQLPLVLKRSNDLKKKLNLNISYTKTDTQLFIIYSNQQILYS